MKCNVAGMNGCHDPGNDCAILIFIIFIFGRLVAGDFFIFTYVVANGRDHSFAAIIFFIILTLVGWWKKVFIQCNYGR